MRRAAPTLALFAVLLLLPAAAMGASRTCERMKQRLVSGGGGASGLLVVDAGSGRTLCSRAAKRGRSLASNTKLFTTATALGRFGPRHRIPTRLLAGGVLDRRGVLRGDLYLRGGGDPALGSPAFYKRFIGLGTNLFGLKGQLRAAGVRAVSGTLYADDSIFDRRRGVADSGFATSPYIGPLSGLAFNSGYSSSSGIGFAADPAIVAARKLAANLRKAGIGVRGGVVRRPAPAGAEPLATVRSPTMQRLAEATNVPSNNFFAEMLIKLAGARFGGAGSTAAGAGVVERFARSRGSGVHAVDGSGLTRSNRASPAQVVRLLISMQNSRLADPYVQGLALSAREGTVDGRMDGTAAAGRCRVKTGTLTGVSSLSGLCFNRSGRVVAFSVLMNGVYDLGRAHYEQDRIAAAVARY
jgi:serine-type D-Ala-D-Ala carboxypeptidase/endopeptidase (penicillin-binding protein 4)